MTVATLRAKKYRVSKCKCLKLEWKLPNNKKELLNIGSQRGFRTNYKRVI